MANGSVVLLISPEAMTNQFVQDEALYALQRLKDGASNVKPFIIRDPQLVYYWLNSQPELVPFAHLAWVELTDIQNLSLAKLSEMMGA